MTSPHQGRFIDNPERPPARHDSLAGQSAFADRGSAPALPSVLRCARPPSPTFCAASVRQVSRACRPPPFFPTDTFESRKRRSLAAALPNNVSAANEITESRGRQEPTDSQHLCRSTSQNTTTPFRRKSPADSAPTRPARADFPPSQRQALQTPRHGLSPPGSRNAEGSLPDASRRTQVSPAASYPWASRAKTPPPEKLLRALHLALHLSPRQADRRTPFGALPHFDKTPRSAARGPAVTPAVAAPSFRSDLAPESAAGRIVQP